jgi:DNA repair protein RadC
MTGTVVYEYRFQRRRVGELSSPISTPIDVLPVLTPLFEGAESERLIVLALNTKNRVIGAETVYVGNVAGAPVRVGELFRLGVRLNASSIIVAHNHPSGDPTPSSDDLSITGELVKAGKLLDIGVLDHIVVAEGGRHLSLRAQGRMEVAP